MYFKHFLSKVYFNFRGFSTNRKIVVIESDDWGSIRMPSKDVYTKLLKAGYPVDLHPFERYDSLASDEDLNLLFNLLSTFKDKNGNQPTMTANCVVANPDFEKIKNDKFTNYHYELITETFKRYPTHNQNLDLWLQAKNEKIFYPQFHAREHVNVSMFMQSLQQGDEDVLFGFDCGLPGTIRKSNVRNGNYFVEATNYSSEADKKQKIEIYCDGLDLFADIFGYKSESIIAPNYIWNESYNNDVKLKGVKYIQGARKTKQSDFDYDISKSRYTGQLTENGLLNTVRNCSFEPTLSKASNPVDYCLKELEIAFNMHKPAIINSHRLNFIGFIDTVNRDTNLKYLNQFFKSALKQWPDIEFMTTVELGKLICEKIK